MKHVSLLEVNRKGFLPETGKLGTSMLVKIPSKPKHPISLCQYCFWFSECQERAAFSCFLLCWCCGFLFNFVVLIGCGFFCDSSDLLQGLLETNTSVLMRVFHALIQPASWLFPKRIIYFSSVTGFSGPNKSVHLSQMNFLGSPSVRVSAHLPKDGKLRSGLSAGVCVTA